MVVINNHARWRRWRGNKVSKGWSWRKIMGLWYCTDQSQSQALNTIYSDSNFHCVSFLKEGDKLLTTWSSGECVHAHRKRRDRRKCKMPNNLQMANDHVRTNSGLRKIIFCQYFGVVVGQMTEVMKYLTMWSFCHYMMNQPTSQHGEHCAIPNLPVFSYSLGWLQRGKLDGKRWVILAMKFLPKES